MKLSEIILQMQAVVPRLTDELTDTIPMGTVAHGSGSAAIITPSAHGLAIGDAVFFNGVKTPLAFASVVFDVPTLRATFVTTLAHDLTTGTGEPETVTLTGAGNAYDGTHTLVSVANRKTFVLQFTADLSALPTVGLTAIGIANIFNTLQGSFAVSSVPTTLIFTVVFTDPTSDLGALDISAATLRAKPRVTGAVNAESAFEAYDTDNLDGAQTWIYVIKAENSVSRDRRTNLDSVSTEQLGDDFRQWLIQPFSILVATSASGQAMGIDAVDLMEDLRPAIFRAVLGKAFATGLSITLTEQTQFVGDGGSQYDRATYWHSFDFETISQIQLDDTIGADDSVAFRDINITQKIDVGQDQSEATGMSDTIDLDTVSLGA